MTVDLREFYARTGLRACYSDDGKIAESYLLSEDELKKIEELLTLIEKMPNGFEMGIFEVDGEKYCVLKCKTCTLVAVAGSENFSQIHEKVANSKVLADGG